MAPLFQIRRSPSLGTHVVASRRISYGELILLEAPLVSTRSPAPDIPSSSAEWFLVHALLVQKYGRDWAAGFCADARTAAGDRDDEEAAAWLCSYHGKSVEEIALLFAVVRSNAFCLETALLSVEYGAAFYQTACRFNHSCRPNCTSIRVGGNMVMFAADTIPAGTELRHSYLPPRLLVQPRDVRSAHLPFTCACARCADEAAAPCASLKALRWPPGHALSAMGLDVAAFKLACASAEVDEVLEQGAQLLGGLEPRTSLARSPLGILEITAPIIAAYFGARLSGRKSTPNRDDRTVRLAAQLQAWCCELIRRAHEDVARRDRRQTALPAAELLADAALVAMRLVEQLLAVERERSPNASNARDGAPREGASEGTFCGAGRGRGRQRELDHAAMCALRRSCARYGCSFEWLRDDMPCLVDPSSKTLPPMLVEAIATTDASPAGTAAAAVASTAALLCPPATRALAGAAGLALVLLRGAAGMTESEKKAVKLATTWTFMSDRVNIMEALEMQLGEQNDRCPNEAREISTSRSGD